MFSRILLGKQYILNEHRLRFHQQETDIKDCLKEHFRLLKRATIYSPEAIDTIMQLFKDILLENNEKTPDLETIISKFEELLDDNKSGNNESPKNNGEDLDENKEKNGTE